MEVFWESGVGVGGVLGQLAFFINIKTKNKNSIAERIDIIKIIYLNKYTIDIH